MAYVLAIAVAALLLTYLVALFLRRDPHHAFLLALMPLIDYEHRVGTPTTTVELTEQSRKKAA